MKCAFCFIDINWFFQTISSCHLGLVIWQYNTRAASLCQRSPQTAESSKAVQGEVIYYRDSYSTTVQLSSDLLWYTIADPCIYVDTAVFLRFSLLLFYKWPKGSFFSLVFLNQLILRSLVSDTRLTANMFMILIIKAAILLSLIKW